PDLAAPHQRRHEREPRREPAAVEPRDDRYAERQHDPSRYQPARTHARPHAASLHRADQVAVALHRHGRGVMATPRRRSSWSHGGEPDHSTYSAGNRGSRGVDWPHHRAAGSANFCGHTLCNATLGMGTRGPRGTDNFGLLLATLEPGTWVGAYE